jgi:hypothetical protein
MTELLTKETAHENLLRDAIHGRFTEAEAQLWMILLHTHAIHLRAGSVEDGNHAPLHGSIILPAQTQRGAAQVIASLWREKSKRKKPGGEDERQNYVYWYHQYNLKTPYEVASDIPEALTSRLSDFRGQLAQDPRILAIASED